MTKENYEETQKKKYPDQPWMSVKEWKDGIIVSSNKPLLFFSLIVIVILTITILTFLSSARKTSGSDKIILYSLLANFVIFQTFATSYFITILLRFKKFGDSKVKLNTFPGVIGGTFQGTLEIPSIVNAPYGFKATLECIKTYKDPDSRKRIIREELYTESIYLNGTITDNNNTTVPFCFDIPYDNYSSDIKIFKYGKDYKQISWILKIEAKIEGLDFQTLFTVPIYKFSDSNPNHITELEAKNNISFTNRTPNLILKENDIIQDNKNNKLSLIFPAFRARKSFFNLLGFTAMWSSITLAIFLINFKGPNKVVDSYTFYMFAIFVIINIVMIYNLFHLLSFKSSIIFNKGNIEIYKGHFHYSKPMIVPYNKIKDITFKKGWGVEGKRHNMIFSFKDGRKTISAMMLKGEDIRNTLKEIITSNLNIKI